MSEQHLEQKLVAPSTAGDLAAALLGHLCDPDPDHPASAVSSVYYDTPGLQSYQESRNGDWVKQKVRLRWYEPSDGTSTDVMSAFLEVKQREGSSRRKQRRMLALSRSWLTQVSLDDPELRALPYQLGAGEPRTVPADLLPVLDVTYARLRFVCPFSGARVCLDRGIHATRWNPTLLPSLGVARLDATVVEIKGRRLEWVPWVTRLAGFGFRWCRFSKYEQCMARLVEDRDR